MLIWKIAQNECQSIKNIESVNVRFFTKKKTNHVGLTCKSWKRDVQNHKTPAENIMKINPSKNVAN